MPGTAKALTACTVGGLVAATAYTVALGGSGWVWFAWVVLVLLTVAAMATREE